MKKLMKKKNAPKKDWGAEITKWVIQRGFYEARLRHHTQEEAYYRNHRNPTSFTEAHRDAHAIIAQHLLAEKRYAEGRIRLAENIYFEECQEEFEATAPGRHAMTLKELVGG